MHDNTVFIGEDVDPDPGATPGLYEIGPFGKATIRSGTEIGIKPGFRVSSGEVTLEVDRTLCGT